MAKCIGQIWLPERKIFVNCGKCYMCVERYAKQWAFRLQQENKVSSSALFVTLTYDDENLPINSDGQYFRYTDVQKFLKKLRKRTDMRIKFYCVGERGSLYERVHWHIILFNALEKDILKSWELGFVNVKKLTNGRIVYALKYLQKDDQANTKVVCSQGIGKNYLSKNNIRFHKDGFKPVVKSGRYSIALSRYYKEKIFKTQIEKDLYIENNKNKFGKIKNDYHNQKQFEQKQKEYHEKANIIKKNI